MDDYQGFFQILMIVCGTIITAGAVFGVIAKWIRPAFQLKKRFDRIETETNENRVRIASIGELNILMCRGIITLMDNAVTGNSADKIKQAKQEMQDYLITNLGLPDKP